MTCFDTYEKDCTACSKQSCRHWIDSPISMNCTIISAKRGPKTLQEVGDVFGVTRMRICQLEKRILKKLNTVINREIKF